MKYPLPAALVVFQALSCTFAFVIEITALAASFAGSFAGAVATGPV